MPPKPQPKSEYASAFESVTDSVVIDEVMSRVAYAANLSTSVALQTLEQWLASDHTILNNSGDNSTNIVDVRTKRMYNIPPIKIPVFFGMLENCRRNNVVCHFTERQGEYSGIMLDFDIYQTSSVSLITPTHISAICSAVMSIISRNAVLEQPAANSKPITHYACVLARQSVTATDKNAYKDGIHILFPTIMITREFKAFIIRELLDKEHILRIFADVPPAPLTEYSSNKYLDTNSKHVPVYFVGSCKTDSNKPYGVKSILSLCSSMHEGSIMITDVTQHYVNMSTFNMCYEMSLNFQVEQGHFTKVRYVPNAELAAVFASRTKVVDQTDGAMLLCSNDAVLRELSMYVDLLSTERSDDYMQWREVLCALASRGSNYKQLAISFSKKSRKYNPHSFEQEWARIIHSNATTRPKLTINSIYYWAKLDSPEKYEGLRKTSLKKKIYDLIHNIANEGCIGHYEFASILSTVMNSKYRVDIPKGEKTFHWYEFITEDDKHVRGEMFKWRKSKMIPPSIQTYISSNLRGYMESLLSDLKAATSKQTEPGLIKYYGTLFKNFQASVRMLSNITTVTNISKACETCFYDVGFSEKLDADPMLRGVANGVLKLSRGSAGPKLITGWHNYAVSKYTNVEYVPFDPRDPQTAKLLKALRSMHPDDEPDSHEFLMSYLASTMDNQPKESICLNVVGDGANAKSTLMELQIAAIGNEYGVKIPLSFLTSEARNGDNATPVLMSLKDASFAYCSENNENQVLNMSKIKELTGLETMTGRGMCKEFINFKPHCHIMITTNHAFEIRETDWGTWRRILFLRFKMQFRPESEYDPTNKFHRIAIPEAQTEWTTSDEMKSRYLSILVWYHYWLHVRYNGQVMRVPHDHLTHETAQYRDSQDVYSRFITHRCIYVANKNEERHLENEISAFLDWNRRVNTERSTLTVKYAIEQFKKTELSKHIVERYRGAVLVGVRFLKAADDEPGEGERYFRESVINFNQNGAKLPVETVDDYYERICREYDSCKHIFMDSVAPPDECSNIMVSDMRLVKSENIKRGQSSAEAHLAELPEDDAAHILRTSGKKKSQSAVYVNAKLVHDKAGAVGAASAASGSHVGNRPNKSDGRAARNKVPTLKDLDEADMKERRVKSGVASTSGGSTSVSAMLQQLSSAMSILSNADAVSKDKHSTTGDKRSTVAVATPIVDIAPDESSDDLGDSTDDSAATDVSVDSGNESAATDDDEEDSDGVADEHTTTDDTGSDDADE